MRKRISIVIPVFNEEAVVRKFLDQQLTPVLKGMKPYEFEIVLVNDGSDDKTIQEIKEAEINKCFNVVLISFVRNFGKEVALTAGINHAKGDAVIVIDADGQHPVSAIPKLVNKWENGAVVVTAIRGHNTTKHKVASFLYYRMMRMMGNKQVVPGELDYRLMDRQVVDDFNQFTERNRMARGLIDWLGYPQEYIKVRTLERLNSKSTYSVKKLAQLAVNSLASSSRTPLVIFGYIGIFIMIVSFLLGMFILIQQYIMGDPLGLDWSGAVAMSVFVSFLVGLVLVSQAMTALYIAQIHTESKGRPLYVIDKRKSFGLPKEK